MSKKQFIIAWGAGYDHDHKVMDESEITEDNGFDEGDRNAIKELEVAEAHRCDDICTVTVLRIEDKQ
jgi:hypothetical protein